MIHRCKSFFKKHKLGYDNNIYYQILATIIVASSIIISGVSVYTEILNSDITRYIYGIFVLMLFFRSVYLIIKKHFILGLSYLYPIFVLSVFEAFLSFNLLMETADQILTDFLIFSARTIFVLFISICLQLFMPQNLKKTHLNKTNEKDRIWLKLIYIILFTLGILLIIVPDESNFTAISIITTAVVSLMNAKNIFTLFFPYYSGKFDVKISTDTEKKFFFLKASYLLLIVSQAITLFVFHTKDKVIAYNKRFDANLDISTSTMITTSIIFVILMTIIAIISSYFMKHSYLLNSWEEKAVHKHSGRPRGLKRPYKRKEYKEYKKHKN